jgi:chromate transporter
MLDLLWSFLKIGCTGYGGGPSMIPLVKEEIVNLRQWMSAGEFIDVLAIANALPGPLAAKLSAYIGYTVEGIPGAVSATLAMIMPTVIALVLLLQFVAHFSQNEKVKSMLLGLKPVVVALLAFAAYDMAPDSLKDIATWLIGISALGIMIFTKIPPFLLILAGALAGIVLKL